MTDALTLDAAREIVAVLRDVMERELATVGVTKRQALRMALVWAISSKTLSAGVRLPAETTLAPMLGVSLGTVQAALGQVQDLGLIERRRGDGTRVLAGVGFSSSIWHFRMYDIVTSEPFRILDQKVEILQSCADGAWSDHLGPCLDYSVIRRQIEGTNGIRVGAEMVLDARLVPPDTLSANALRLANLRTVLEKQLNVKATHSTHRVVQHRMSPRRMAIYGLPSDTQILKVEARAFLNTRKPFYFQTLYVPADRVELEF